MNSPKSIAYSFLIGDLFHYGHLKMLEVARNNSDYHICGVISDSVVEKWISPNICNYIERRDVVAGCKYVDEVYCQDSMDPTENLKKIHEKYPDYKLVLVQNHHLWESVLGSSFISEINGEIITHDFYPNLSRENISKAFFKSIAERQNLNKTAFNDLRIGDTNYFQEYFSTKANTLQKLKNYLKNALIERAFVFTILQWDNDEEKILKSIEEIFGSKEIVIRSSSLNEDSLNYSNAGHYKSVLNVKTNVKDIRKAIEEVILSYAIDPHLNKQNQILVQQQTREVTISGVVFTRNLITNTPYYLVNYDEDSGKTDSVTGGMSSEKVEILRDIELEAISHKWKNLIKAIREVEGFFKGVELDIEFAIKSDGTIVIFQVRPIAANSKFHFLDDDLIKENVRKCTDEYKNLYKSNIVLSDELFLSDMAFWNPAELIGDRPNYLDYSFFNHLIMKNVWNEALLPMGYTKVDEDLQVLIGGKPYVNVHNAFLSLLPAKLPIEIKTKLLNYYNYKLKKYPNLHDKIEFEIVHNCYRFDFERVQSELIENGFSYVEIRKLKNNLRLLTNKILNQFSRIITNDDKSRALLENKYNIINQSSKSASWKEKIDLIYQLIEDCKIYGTPPFTRVARFAFIGNTLLKSLINAGIISKNDSDLLLGSISTVATIMDQDFNLLIKKKKSIADFISKYGHLRPGTYDITRFPYSKNLAYLNLDMTSAKNKETVKFYRYKIDYDKLNKIKTKISEACEKHKIECIGYSLLDFISKSIKLREFYKFIYTKNISLALELVAEIGSEIGFSREDLANLDYYSITNNRESCSREEIKNIWKNLIQSRKEEKRRNLLLSLPSIIFNKNDFVVVSSFNSTPNFITNAIIDSEVICIDDGKSDNDIGGKIVVVERADPGYDWIFTKKINGLITKYGGAGSHMAIRCSEFGIPAAIGCGALLFSKILSAKKIQLNCSKRTIITY